jgi:hypothetical protein
MQRGDQSEKKKKARELPENAVLKCDNAKGRHQKERNKLNM